MIKIKTIFYVNKSVHKYFALYIQKVYKVNNILSIFEKNRLVYFAKFGMILYIVVQN